MPEFINPNGSVSLHSGATPTTIPDDPPSPNAATHFAFRRTDATTYPHALAEVSMFGGGTSNLQGVIALRTMSGASPAAEPVERLRVHTNGFVGIGTAAPAQALDVAGTVRATAFQGDGSALTGISDTSRVSKSGDTMTGALNLPPNGLRVETQLVVANGNVGIGTTTPTSGKLQFGNALGNKMVVWDGGAADRYGIGLNGGNLNAFIPAGARFSIRHNGYDGAEQFTVTGGGSVSYAGTLSKLDVAENFGVTIRAADMSFGHSGRRGSPGRALVDYGGALVLNFGPDWPDCIIHSQLHVNGPYLYVNGTAGEQVYIGGDGWGGDVQVGSANAGISNMAAYNKASNAYMNMYARSFISTSDARHKEDVEGVSNAVDTVMRLRAVSFRWKGEKPGAEKDKDKDTGKGKEKKKQIGLLAQEVQEAIPEAVSKDRHGDLSLDYSAITAVLLQAVKEQAEQIKQLQQKISELEQLVKR